MATQQTLYLDIETVADDGARGLLPMPEPSARLVDPKKRDVDAMRKRDAQYAAMSLDGMTGRIVVYGACDPDGEPQVRVCRTLVEEEHALHVVSTWIASGLHLIGFHLSTFDLPFLLTRALVLSVTMPAIEFRPFNTHEYTDLALDPRLKLGRSVLPRDLHTVCRRLGIEVDDAHTGADVAALWAAGRVDDVVAHCRSDLTLTMALAERLGVL